MIAFPVGAAPLDSAYQYWQGIQYYCNDSRDTNFAHFDSTELTLYTNEGLMRVSLDIGIIVLDTLTMVTDQVQYTLDTGAIEGGIVARPFAARWVSNDRSVSRGLQFKSQAEFSSYGSEQKANGPIEFDVRGRTLFANPPPQAGRIIISIPLKPLWLARDTTWRNDTTNVDENDRFGALYWACYRASVSREEIDRAHEFWQNYQAHVSARGGKYVGPPEETQ